MTSIVSSTNVVGPPQVDGRCNVRETHTDSDGETYEFEPLIDPELAQAVLSARAVRLNALLAVRDAADEVVYGTLLPYTKLQFRDLFGAKKYGIDAFEATFEAHPALTTEQKAAVRTGFKDFNAAKNIVRPFLQPVLDMLGLFVALGLLTTQERDAIIAAGNG